MPQAPVQPVAPPQPTPKAPAIALTVRDYLGDGAIKARFAELLGERAPQFCQSVITASKSKTLSRCDPKTVVTAAVIAATLDMPIDNSLGYAYIVPYNDKNLGMQAQFQMGWKGFFQLAMNSGAYAKITTNEVYEGEIEVKNRFTEEYEFHPRKSDKIVGYLAYYRLVNGITEKYLYMSREEIEAHARKYSQSYRTDKYGTSQWAQNFDAMAKKTVLKLLLSKYGKLSIQMQMAQRFDQAVVKGDALSRPVEDIQDSDITYIDNEPDPIDQQAGAEAIRQAAQRSAAMANAAEQFQNMVNKESKQS